MSKEMAQWAKKCKNMVKYLQSHKHCWIFNQPVDHVQLSIPDYPEVIKRPMDLGTVRTNLEAGLIAHPQQFHDDVLLTFENAMRYNPEENDVHIMAKELKQMFLAKWETSQVGIMEKFNNEPAAGEVASIAPSAPSTAAAPAAETTVGAKRVHEADFDEKAEKMSYEDKLQLSHNMEKLPSKKLGAAVQIIHDRALKKGVKYLRPSPENDEEVEIDINVIDAPCLRYLEKFVNDSLAKKKKKVA